MYTFFHIIYFSLFLSLCLSIYLSIYLFLSLSIFSISLFLSIIPLYILKLDHTCTHCTHKLYLYPPRPPPLNLWPENFQILEKKKKKEKFIPPVYIDTNLRIIYLKKKELIYTRFYFRKLSIWRISTITNRNFLSRYVGVSRRKVQP